MPLKSKLQRHPPERLARRALLAAGLGGLAAFAAEAVAAPARVMGANGDTVRVGKSHDGTARTQFRVTGPKVAALHGRSAAGDGVIGETGSGNRSGLYGSSTNPDGYGVTGRNTTNGAVGQLGARRAGLWGAAPKNAYALEAVGALRLHSSGVAVMPQGALHVVFDAPPWVNQNTALLATTQVDYMPDHWVSALVLPGNPPRIKIWRSQSWNGYPEIRVAWLAFDAVG